MLEALRDPIWQFLGVLAAIAVPFCAWHYDKSKKPTRTESEPIAPPDPIADLRSTWVAEGPDDLDAITIQSQSGRTVSGTRIYTYRKSPPRQYEVTGYFDGMTLALAVTASNKLDARTLTIVMLRTSGTTFEGKRVYRQSSGKLGTIDRVWKKS